MKRVNFERRTTRRGDAQRRGSILVEFALVAFALYLLLAAGISLGRAIFAGQVVQSAAHSMARELATISLGPGSATLDFDAALARPSVRARIYDPSALVIDRDLYPTAADLDAYFAGLPVVNQLLRPLYVVDRVGGANYLRYPGALVTGPDGLTVMIPRVATAEDGTTTVVDWVAPVEEVLPVGQTTSHFGIDAPDTQWAGVASVRVSYPYQSATLSAFGADGTPATGAGGGGGLPAGYALAGGSDAGLYAGDLGLGEQFAYGRSVRPFRKLITGQASFRREVVE
ncbi:MAG: pilus assembly protein [Planctomycetes bacterium]|nr:pilus assembly protein [Planctomycetota bacterium]MCB9904824.1 pilus assembly protein [Planctomycetota bacterium]